MKRQTKRLGAFWAALGTFAAFAFSTASAPPSRTAFRTGRKESATARFFGRFGVFDAESPEFGDFRRTFSFGKFFLFLNFFPFFVDFPFRAR